MAPKKSKFRDDAPWRVGAIPKVGGLGVHAYQDTPQFQYAVVVMNSSDPVGKGLAKEAVIEPAGDDCVIPGQGKAFKFLGFSIRPVKLENPFSKDLIKPVIKEIQTFSEIVDKAFSLMSYKGN